MNSKLQKPKGVRRSVKQSKSVKPMLRIGATIGLPEVLITLGADPSEVLAEVGINLSLFDNPNNQISYLARGRLMAHCATRTRCPHFGLLVGQRAGLGGFGLVGLLAKYSPDVESALHSLSRYMHLHVRGANANLAMESDFALLEYQIYQKRAHGNDQVGDGAVAVAFNILRELCGSDWTPVEIRFAHRKPLDVSPYESFFQVPLRFDTSQYAVAFSNSWLNQSVPGTSPELVRLLQQEINKLEIRQDANFLDQLRSLLRTTLVTGHSSAEQVAKLLSINRRTLNRYLNALGTNFREVADEIRFEISRQLLEDSAMDVSQIALFLGYSNASAFTRAFRRWSSTTPANWRKVASLPAPPRQ